MNSWHASGNMEDPSRQKGNILTKSRSDHIYNPVFSDKGLFALQD